MNPSRLYQFLFSNSFAILFNLILILFISIPTAQAQDSVNTVRVATESQSPLGLTVEEAYGKELFFDYGKFENGPLFKMDVTLKPDEITWHELWEGGRLETDSTESIKLDDHRLLISFTELDGSFIVVYADFMSGETSFCGLIAPGETDQTLCFTGTMTMNK